MFSFRFPRDVSVHYRFLHVYGRRMRLLVVRPKESAEGGKLPCVLWLHGGGYATGMPEMVFFSRAIDLVTECGAVVVAPDYTLSPAAPYPQALKECHAALKYIKKYAEDLGIDRNRIGVGGESAGGGLCAALCMFAKDHGSVNVAFQLPLYPMLNCFDTASSRDNHGKVWNTKRNHMGWWLYLRDMEGRKVPSYASPSQRKDYRGLPPCYTFVGDMEPFYDETLTYVRQLRKAGVEAEVDVYRGVYHAFDMVEAEKPIAGKAAEVFVQKVKQMLEQYQAEN